MSYLDIRNSLSTLEPGADSNIFSYLAKLASYASLAKDDDELQKTRELVIRSLERREVFAGYEVVVEALIRTLGLFPYLNLGDADAAMQLAAEAHRPAEMPSNIIFTAKQAEVYRELMAGRSVVLSAPTSFGKSLIIDAIVASGKHKNIVVVVPTLALVDETRRRLFKFSDKYKVITHLSQEPATHNIFVHTQERVIENKHIQSVDFFVIDEFYKLGIDESADSDSRATLLNQAFYQLVKRAKQFYMLGPNIHELPDGFGQNFQCTFIKTDFSTVAADMHQVAGKGKDEERLIKLLPNLIGPTLVFCGSVKKARNTGKLIAGNRKDFMPGKPLTAAIKWLGENYHPKWGLVNALQKGVGIHHAKLPRSISQLLVRLFNDGHLDFLVCTSTLIEGVNTAARNVVIYDNKIATKKYDFFTFNNIKGRSGRMWQHFVGHVYLFHEQPARELEFVDVPMFTQGSNAPDALLVQLGEEDLTPTSRKRMDSIWLQRSLSLECIKSNSGFDPEGQIALAREIESNPQGWSGVLGWDGIPQYKQLLGTLELACKHLGFRSSDGVRSVKQLTFRIWAYKMDPSYSSQVLKSIDGKAGDEADEALEEFLEFVRQWVTFRTPRLLMAMDRIQKEVLSRCNAKAGNYAFFSSQLESLFMNPVATALEEYGVPLQLADRLIPKIGNPKTLDDALDSLRQRTVTSFKELTAFEADLIHPLCRRQAPK